MSTDRATALDMDLHALLCQALQQYSFDTVATTGKVHVDYK